MRVWVAVLAMLTMAGCGSPEPPTQADPVAGGAPTVDSLLPWGFEECQGAVAIVGIDVSEIAHRLPSGFRSLSMQEIAPSPVPLPSGATQANFGVEMFQCKSGTGLSGSLVDAVYGSYFTAVEPPAELRNPAHAYHFVKWEVIDEDVARRAALVEAGVPAFEGTTTFPDFDRNVDGFDVHGSMVLGPWGPHFIDGFFAAPYDAPPSFDEFTPSPNGLVVWETQLPGADIRAGGGVLKVPVDSFAGSVLGGSEVQFVGFAGRVNFRDATILVPSENGPLATPHGH